MNSGLRIADGELRSMVFVALGSNLGDSVQIIRRAMDRLEQLSIKPLLRSSLWESTPVDCPHGSPRFINAIVALSPQPRETPERLLAQLQDVEKEFGRQLKKVLNEPRPLDLDLIAFALERRSTEKLVLPHPRAPLRRFVLQPLAEIAPQFVLPGQRLTVGQLLARLRNEEIVERVDAPARCDNPPNSSQADNT